MSPTTSVRAVDPADFKPGSPAYAGFVAVLEAATEADGAGPLDEAALLALRHRGLEGSTMLVAGADGDLEGFGWLHGDDGSQVDLVVAPGSRSRGLGTAMAEAVLERRPEATLSAWSHRNHPAAAALAKRLGFARVRDLWVMRRALPAGGGDELPPLPDRSGEVAVRLFEPGRDEDAFLALNAEAFAGHPEQGRMTRVDLDQRMAEPWFDAGGFFVAEARANAEGFDAGELLGFHWTKVHPAEPPHGEVYVVGVSPRAQGMGLGTLLTLTGLHHLDGRGLGEVMLHVESDNAPAIAVYSRLRFSHAAHDTHVMYRRG